MCVMDNCVRDRYIADKQHLSSYDLIIRQADGNHYILPFQLSGMFMDNVAFI